MKNNRFFTGILSLTLVFGTILAGCGNPTGGGGNDDPEITGFNFTQTAGLQEGAATAAAGAAAGTFGSEVGGTAPFTYALAAGDGDTNNGLFTIDGTNLKIGSAALTAGTKSIRVEVKDAKNEPPRGKPRGIWNVEQLLESEARSRGNLLYRLV
jgi:hypothetical protein